MYSNTLLHVASEVYAPHVSLVTSFASTALSALSAYAVVFVSVYILQGVVMFDSDYPDLDIVIHTIEQ